MNETLNSVVLVGRVGGDPDVKYFESGKVKATFSLAVNRRGKDAPPDWFNLEVWGKTAEVAANYVRKGSQIAIKGELKIDQWSDKNTGVQRSKPLINVNDLELLGSKREQTPAAEDDKSSYGF